MSDDAHSEDKKAKRGFDLGAILQGVQGELEKAGIAVDLSGGSSCFSWPKGDSRVKVVCVSPGLKDSVEELGKAPRDQVVMVRVDAETSAALDAWVETGAVKSRSEAAALFIREGLNVRSDELARLKDALDDVDAARERLRERARQVFGDEAEASGEPEG